MLCGYCSCLLTLLLCCTVSAQGQLLQNSVHRTPAAERPVNDLWCYHCRTMNGGDRCADLRGNHTALSHKCQDDRRLCMVKRISYTTSNENSTSTLKMWALERNCTKKCEPGCIVIGERTKLYACTSCCDSSLCNSGNRGTSLLHASGTFTALFTAGLVSLHHGSSFMITLTTLLKELHHSLRIITAMFAAAIINLHNGSSVMTTLINKKIHEIYYDTSVIKTILTTKNIDRHCNSRIIKTLITSMLKEFYNISSLTTLLVIRFLNHHLELSVTKTIVDVLDKLHDYTQMILINVLDLCIDNLYLMTVLLVAIYINIHCTSITTHSSLFQYVNLNLKNTKAQKMTTKLNKLQKMLKELVTKTFNEIHNCPVVSKTLFIAALFDRHHNTYRKRVVTVMLLSSLLCLCYLSLVVAMKVSNQFAIPL